MNRQPRAILTPLMDWISEVQHSIAPTYLVSLMSCLLFYAFVGAEVRARMQV